MADRQISANISEETGKLVDDYAEAHGVKKGYLIETALLHHLLALRELPADVIIPPRVVVTEESMRSLIELLERPPATTPALKKLMRGGRAKRG
jgi:uncharacterized protein (DUF1778 family)